MTTYPPPPDFISLLPTQQQPLAVSFMNSTSKICTTEDFYGMLNNHIPFILLFGGLFYTVGAVSGFIMKNLCQIRGRRGGIIGVGGASSSISSSYQEPLQQNSSGANNNGNNMQHNQTTTQNRQRLLTTYIPPPPSPPSQRASSSQQQSNVSRITAVNRENGSSGGEVVVIVDEITATLTPPSSSEYQLPLQSPRTTFGHCVICMDQESSVVLIPCGHICVCKDQMCRNSVSQTCPVCRTDVQLTTSVFMS